MVLLQLILIFVQSANVSRSASGQAMPPKVNAPAISQLTVSKHWSIYMSVCWELLVKPQTTQWLTADIVSTNWLQLHPLNHIACYYTDQFDQCQEYIWSTDQQLLIKYYKKVKKEEPKWMGRLHTV